MADPETDDVLESLAGLPTLAHPTASPDGREVAFYHDGSGRNELHVLNVETGETEQWSDGEVPRNARWHVEWSADGERVFFHLDDDGDEQNDIYAIDRDGTVEPVVEMPGQVHLMDVGKDGETLLLGSTRDGQMNLYTHDLASGETTKRTDYERAVWTGLLSPDGERMAYATNEADDFENVDVYVAPRATTDGSDPRVLDVGETGAENLPVDWGPDGERLLVSDNSTDLTRSGVYDLETDAVTWYESDFEEDPHGFTPDGEGIVVTRTREAAKVPVVYDLESGESRELDLPEGVASLASDAELTDDRLLLTHTTPTRRPDLLAYDLAADETETLHEAAYGPFSPADFADAEYFTVESDGVPETAQEAVVHDPYETLEIGALLYDSGERPSPLVVNPHGGPRAMDTKSFDLYTQFLVQRGFSVLQVNYRGSTGRGHAFVQQLYDDWGGAEQGDVATAAEHVLDTREWVDDERMAVFGGSYGGYSAYWQMVQYPALYDAGVAWIGLTDLEDQYENTMPHYRTELMEKNIGTPAENPDLYRERSPIEYVENLAAPLFMLHGVNDRRVPVSQARLFRDALDDFGYTEGPEADYEYEELGAEGHASSDIDQKIRLFGLLDDFLSRRLGTAAVAADD
ncbi:S9 family peptidase [Haloarcula marina]|uniref:S9 family peptidase n=1 Tax=Haloarcula marina TaxID=2961574 RepID=UPI0020B7B2AD|nr:prolyl oligopeptidase family serine peptidase [Halomicroarcula marina]